MKLGASFSSTSTLRSSVSTKTPGPPLSSSLAPSIVCLEPSLPLQKISRTDVDRRVHHSTVLALARPSRTCAAPSKVHAPRRRRRTKPPLGGSFPQDSRPTRLHQARHQTQRLANATKCADYITYSNVPVSAPPEAKSSGGKPLSAKATPPSISGRRLGPHRLL